METGYTFDLVDKKTPREVICEQIEKLNMATKGYVIGHIDSYDGPITSRLDPSGLEAVMRILSTREIEHDVQENLGSIGVEKNRYEVYITAKGLPDYRYRLMFVDYGTVSYPVMLVLERSLSVGTIEADKTVVSIGSVKELEETIEVIFNSKRFTELVQSLIFESIRREK